MAKQIISVILFMVFVFLSALHFYWALGGRWGSKAVYPTTNKNAEPKMPGIIPTTIVAFGLLAIGGFILQQTFFLNFQIPLWLNNYGLWTIASIFMLRAIGEFKYIGFFKKMKHSKFAQNETKYYSPLCLVIAILILIIKIF